MILVDFSHLSMRNLYVAIAQAKPKKVDGQYNTEDFISFYYHLMLQSLRHITSKFKKYGDIVLCIDSKRNWRKEVYPDYKGHRKKDRDKSEVNFEEFYAKVNEFVDVLRDNFPYKVIEVQRAEADDIIGVLAKKYAPFEEVIVVSSDKDFKQVLEYGAELYDPIKKEFIRMSKEDLKKWKLTHILCGDEGDNVPHIKRGTQFTDTFLSFLKENEIYVKTPEEFEELSISEKLYNEFDIYKVNKKGEVLDEKDIFKATPFGPKTAEKFAEDLANNLKENKIYAKNFKRNMELVLFDKIPEDIRESIENEFVDIEFKYDPNGIMKFLTENHLSQQLMNISVFYIEGNKAEERHKTGGSLAEWV